MGPGRRSSNADADALQKQRQKYRKLAANALTEADDPLAVYQEFIQWTLENYADRDPESGLVELLEEATRAFKTDPLVKNDVRYLKIWSLYAQQMDRPGAIGIYAYLVANDIGISYAALYEEYANLLEQDGRCVVNPPIQLDRLIYIADAKKHRRSIAGVSNDRHGLSND